MIVPGLAMAQVQQYSDMPVGGIDFVLDTPEGGVADQRALRAQMKTKVDARFSQLEFDDDLKRLSEDYDRVEPTLDVHQGKIYLTIKLAPRPTVNEVIFEGNERISTKKLRKELALKPDAIFDRHTFNIDFNKLRELYTKKGFFEAELSYRIEPVAGANKVNIVVTISEGRTGHIRGIAFEGFTKKEKSELLEEIHTKKRFALTSWMTQKGVYHEEMVEQDRYTVLNYLHNEGYADADVEVVVTQAPDGRGIVVTFIAERGEPYNFGRATFEGNTLFTDEEVQERIVFKPGERYSPESVREAVKWMTDLYGAKGYIDAVVDYEPRLVPEERAYDVHFIITEGRQCRIGMVRVFGNRNTEERVILHETRLIPGEVFDLRRLEQTEAVLKNIGYFETVNVYATRSPQETEIGPDYRDVHIEVEEAATGNFGVFGGASTDENVFAGVELTEKNFRWRGLRELPRRGPAALRGGGEFLRARANFGKGQTSYTLSWTKPFFKDTCWVVGFDLDRSINGLKSDDYQVRKSGFSLRADYPINRFVRFGTHYRFRYEDVHLKHKDRASEQLREQARNQGTISALGTTLAYDSVDYWHTRGLQSLFTSELATHPGKFNFLALSYLNVFYYPVIERIIFKARWDSRFVQPLFDTGRTNIPLGERLFLGGEGSVRGYRPYSLGPQFEGNMDDPKGGLSSMLVSAELKRCIVPRIDGFVFVDGGYVSGKVFYVDTFRWSVGFGARIDVMNGVPLIVGLGYPLNVAREDKNKDIVRNFFFSIGGRF
jgi:outer membrane protein insertion porin family